MPAYPAIRDIISQNNNLTMPIVYDLPQLGFQGASPIFLMSSVGVPFVKAEREVGGACGVSGYVYDGICPGPHISGLSRHNTDETIRQKGSTFIKRPKRPLIGHYT
jgi:hypothetical protein